jgi:predicted O-linked N-acetylglucosamine transferase (SPINDLY family)
LIFGRKLPQTDHLARLQLADLALDTFPYTSHTTGSDALWAGVPLLTLIGETFGSRVAASLLTAVGLPQLIIDNPTRYVEQAIRLAQDHGELTKMRRHLIEGRGHLPLFDTHRFTRHLEALYTAMRNQQISQEVRAIAVEPLNDTKPISSETAARQCEFPSCP